MDLASLLLIQGSGLLSPQTAYADIGVRVGEAGIACVRLPTGVEVIVSGSLDLGYANQYWTALESTVGVDRYARVFASKIRPVSRSLTRLAAADLDGDGWDELVLTDESGGVEVFDLVSRRILGEWTTPNGDAHDLELADLDGDGAHEILVLDGANCLVYAASGVLQRSSPSTATRLAAGALDSDPALEVALNDGQVLDGVAFHLEWSRPELAHRDLAIADADADGLGEVIVLELAHLTAYRDGGGAALWRFHNNQWYNARLEVQNLDQDPYLELAVGGEHGFSLEAWDGLQLTLDQHFDLAGHGVLGFAFGDPDDDGDLDLIWGSGVSWTAMQLLHVREVSSGILGWQSQKFDRPFQGPEIGDPDGDGAAEALMLSRTSENNACGRVISLSAATLLVEGVSEPITHPDPLQFPGVAMSLCVADLDGDARDEILVGGDGSPEGFLVVLRQSPWGSFAPVLGAPPVYEGGVSAIEVADLEGDLIPEIVVGIDAVSNHQSSRVLVLDHSTAAISWDSGGLGGAQTRIEDLVLANADADPGLEILAVVEGTRLVAFDGATRRLEASSLGDFRSVTVIPRQNQAPLVAVGTGDGRVQLLLLGAGAFLPAGEIVTGSSPVDGLSLLQVGGPVLLAGTGSEILAFRPGLSQPLLLVDGYLFESGRSMRLVPGTTGLLASVPYGVQFFSR